MGKVIALSRQFGSGGARIGQAVAQRLGFRYADRDILAEAARTLQMEPDSLAPFEERIASIWDRVAMFFALGSPDAPFQPPSLPSVIGDQLFKIEREVIESIAAHDSAVIVGRGAAHVLGESQDVLRVFLHAPLQVRITTAMSEYGFDDRATAEQVVSESDRARSRFVRSLTGRDWCDATLYDLTLDTDASGFDGAVDLITRMASARPRRPETSGPAPAGTQERR